MSSWRISRPRVAPIERRTEISRDRAVARVSRRFATLAQTISSTITTTTLEEAGRPPRLGKDVVVAVGGWVDQQLRHRRATLPVGGQGLLVRRQRRLVLGHARDRRALEDRREVRAGLLNRHTRLQAAHELQPPVGRLLHARDLDPDWRREEGVERQRHGDVRGVGAEPLDAGEVGGRHADDGDHLAVDRHDAADRGRLAREPLVPVRVADDGDGRCARPVIGLAEHAAQDGRHADHGEVVSGGLIAGGQLGVAVHEDVQAAHRHARGQAGQRRVGGTQLLDHREGERGPDVPRAGPPRVAVVVRVPDHVVRAGMVEPDQALGLVDVHGLQEQAIHRREQRRVRPDAERERQEDDERPGLGAEQDADGEAQVLDESGHGSPFG